MSEIIKYNQLILFVIFTFRFTIFPSKGVDFGVIATNTKELRRLTIENSGPFEIRYSITPKNAKKNLTKNSRCVDWFKCMEFCIKTPILKI